MSGTYEDGLKAAATFLRGVAEGNDTNAKEWDGVAVIASRKRRGQYQKKAAECRFVAEKARAYATAVEALL